MKVFHLCAVAAGALLAAQFTNQPAAAQTCGTDYTIQEGDSLARIATRVYGKSSQWTVIFYANQDRLGANASLLIPGLAVRIPCLGGVDAALPPAATEEAVAETPPTFAVSAQVKHIEFLTADDYAPFTGRSLPEGGMATDLVNTAMKQLNADAGGAFKFGVSWVNDWSAHLNPLLVTRAFDMGFPWYKPACQNFTELDTDAKFRCQKFFFSKPVYEEQVLLFVKQDSPITFETDAEIPGKKLCRPTGYWTFDLDDQGRNWVKEDKVVLIRPASVEECFRLLLDGSVDAVALNELTGRSALVRLDAIKTIRVIERPVAILSLHVVVAKTHPNARTLIYYINSGFDKIRASGDYDTIVEKHLTQFWEAQSESEQEKAPAATSENADPAAETGTTDSDSTGTTAKATATAESGTAATDN